MRNNGPFTTVVVDPARGRRSPGDPSGVDPGFHRRRDRFATARTGSGSGTRQRVTVILLAVTVTAGCSSSNSPAATDARTTVEATPATALATSTTPTLPSATTPGPTPSPDSSITDPAAVAEALQVQLDALVEATGVPGATAGIRVPGFDDLLIASGVANTTTREAISTDEVFRIGSVTKTFTAAIVLSLVEDGRLNLDDTLDTWYPDVPNAERITIEQLLEHRAGTTDFAPGEEQSLLLGDLEHSYTIDEVVALTSDRPATFEPGEGEGYSNMNYRLLGGVIEKVTGQPFAVELEERITAPLALANTYLDDGSGPAPGHGYFSIDQGASYLDAVDFPNQAAMTIASTAGGIDSSLSDLLGWATALYGGDLLFADTTSLMLDSVEDGWHESADTVIGLGVIGFCPCGDDPPWEPVFIGHDGGFIGSATLLLFEPATGVAMVFHANRDADLELINGFVELAHSAAALIVTDAESQ